MSSDHESRLAEIRTIDPGYPVSSPTASYWQTPPSSIHSYRSNPAPSSEDVYDYAIVGSGISGAMIAYNLIQEHKRSNKPYKIIMLEARGLCSGATGRNGGHTKSGVYRVFKGNVDRLNGDIEEAVRIARLEHNNILGLHSFIRSFPPLPPLAGTTTPRKLADVCDLRTLQSVDIFYSREIFDKAYESVNYLKSVFPPNDPVADYQIHTSTEAQERFLTPDAIGAISYMAGSLRPYSFVTEVLRWCISEGLEVSTYSVVHSLKSGGDHLWEISAVNNKDSIFANKVILATNAYTSSSNLAPQMRGCIIPVRGQVTVQRPPVTSSLLSPRLEYSYSFFYEGGYDYMIQEPRRGDIIIGGGFAKAGINGLDELGITNDGRKNDVVGKWLHSTLKYHFKGHWRGRDNVEPAEEGKDDDGEVVQEWTGIMGYSSDGSPWVGRVPNSEEGLYVSAGFQGHGMVLTFLCAKALVDMMLDKEEGGLMRWFPRSFVASEQRLKTEFRGKVS